MERLTGPLPTSSSRSPHRDFRVALSSSTQLLLVFALVIHFVGCKDDGEGTADGSVDALGDATGDGLSLDSVCPGTAPVGECVWSSNGCCDDVITRMPLECRGGQWLCPRGQVPFAECCGVGSMCQPYPGGGQPPSPMCAPRCRQVEGLWYCGSATPDASADAAPSVDGAAGG